MPLIKKPSYKGQIAIWLQMNSTNSSRRAKVDQGCLGRAWGIYPGTVTFNLNLEKDCSSFEALLSSHF